MSENMTENVAAQAQNNAAPSKSLLVNFFRKLGPGVIAGAADDDPSGIATYSVAGAQFGLGLIWTAWFTWPLMGVVQNMCARIGMVTGQGLAGALRKKFPAPVMWIVCASLLVANTINVGSDLAAMADAANLLTGISSHLVVVVLGVAISWAIIRFRYYQIANVLKWLALVLGAYIVTGFLIKPNWTEVGQAMLHVQVPEKGGWAMIVAIFGTTISPYLFFWQAAQEVEEDKAMGRLILIQRQGATRKQLIDRRIDVTVGTFLTNIVMFFIVLCTAFTLHKNGITEITSSKEVAQALQPLAGEAAMLLYTIGLIGVGLLAIPTLAGSAAYAFSETFRWRHGLDEKWAQARAFYLVICGSTAVGVAMDWLNVNPVKALYYTAVINGLLAPFLLVGILLVARDEKIMLGQPSSMVSQIIVALTTIIMFGAGVGFFFF